MINQILEGYTSNRSVTFRVNTLKCNASEIEKILNDNNISFSKVEWYQDAYILNNAKERDIQNLSIYEEGKIYLQSLSSMIPALYLNPLPNENILDMAAAPGGKTTQMAVLSNNQALITACEKNKIRADRLKYNIEKQGANKITVLNEDARKLSEYFSFDKILLDSPCSGSGTINVKDKNLEKVFTKDLLSRSVQTQQVLLKKAIYLLKIGQEMIYSTCSILKEENEENIQKMIDTGKVEIVPLDLKRLIGVPIIQSRIEGTILVSPSHLYEGFFIAKLKKKEV